MTDPNFAKPLTISRWLMSAIITTSIVGGGIFAVAALFLMESHSPDPAIKAEDDVVVMQPAAAEVTQLKQQTEELKQQVAQIKNGTQEKMAGESRMAQIVVGLTQLKTAYESDTPLQFGIETLKRSLQDSSLQQTLTELHDTTAQGFPSKDDILTEIDTLHQTLQKPTAAPATTPTTWKERAGNLMGQFVRVHDTADLNARKQLKEKMDNLEQAVSFNNFTLATQIAATLPQSPSTTALNAKLQARVKAQNLVQQAIAQVNRSLNKEGIY